jgi:hypothetical protein
MRQLVVYYLNLSMCHFVNIERALLGLRRLAQLDKCEAYAIFPSFRSPTRAVMRLVASFL